MYGLCYVMGMNEAAIMLLRTSFSLYAQPDRPEAWERWACYGNKYNRGGGSGCSESSADGRSATGCAARGRSPYDIPVGGRQPMAFSV